MKYLKFMLAVLICLSVPAIAGAASKCVDCHTEVTPGIVEQFKDGEMRLARSANLPSNPLRSQISSKLCSRMLPQWNSPFINTWQGYTSPLGRMLRNDPAPQLDISEGSGGSGGGG